MNNPTASVEHLELIADAGALSPIQQMAVVTAHMGVGQHARVRKVTHQGFFHVDARRECRDQSRWDCHAGILGKKKPARGRSFSGRVSLTLAGDNRL